MNEVNSNIISRKTYLKKWLNMTDEEAEAEIEQVAKEMSMLEGTSQSNGAVTPLEDIETDTMQEQTTDDNTTNNNSSTNGNNTTNDNISNNETDVNK